MSYIHDGQTFLSHRCPELEFAVPLPAPKCGSMVRSVQTDAAEPVLTDL